MPAEGRLETAGRVGRAHGLDGSFHLTDPRHALEAGTGVTVGGVERTVRRTAGTAERPLVALHGVDDRDAAAALRGEPVLVQLESAPLEDGEWLAEDLVGLRIEGVGRVTRVVSGPSCDLLETDDGTLVPLVSDAVKSLDADAGTAEVDLRFLGLQP